jgi:hypothetical protein
MAYARLGLVDIYQDKLHFIMSNVNDSPVSLIDESFSHFCEKWETPRLAAVGL